jgi:type I restriction enzyme M protein
LFYTTQIPVCLWFLTKDKTNKQVKSEHPQRDRHGEVLFIDARQIGSMVSRTNKAFTNEDIATIADTYHSWRGEPDLPAYQDIPGFCAAVTLDTIREHNHVLTPGRYVGAADIEDDGEPLDQKIERLTKEIRDGLAKRAELQARVLAALDSLTVARDG